MRAKVKEFFVRNITTKNLTVTAAMTAISFILYMFVKFPLPFLFPSFLDVQFSEMPAMLTGFMLGTPWGCVVIVLKCLLKMPFTTTAFVGELGDMVMGLAFVIPSSLIYKRRRTKKGALVGLIVGTLSEVAVAIIINGLVLIPFYAKAFGWDAVIGMMLKLFPKMTRKNIYAYYLPLSVLPLNIMRLSVCSVVTFFLYKRLHKWINSMFAPRNKKKAAAVDEPPLPPASEEGKLEEDTPVATLPNEEQTVGQEERADNVE